MDSECCERTLGQNVGVAQNGQPKTRSHMSGSKRTTREMNCPERAICERVAENELPRMSPKRPTPNTLPSSGPVAKYFYGSDDEKTAYPGKIVEVKLKNGAQGPSVVGYKVKYDDGDVEWVNEKEVVKMMRLWEKVCSKKEKRRSKSRGRGQ